MVEVRVRELTKSGHCVKKLLVSLLLGFPRPCKPTDRPSARHRIWESLIVDFTFKLQFRPFKANILFIWTNISVFYEDGMRIIYRILSSILIDDSIKGHVTIKRAVARLVTDYQTITD